jgi:hypothetical protein
VGILHSESLHSPTAHRLSQRAGGETLTRKDCLLLEERLLPIKYRLYCLSQRGETLKELLLLEECLLSMEYCCYRSHGTIAYRNPEKR